MILSRLQDLLNRSIESSGRARELCRQLDGRLMSLAVEGTPVRIVMDVRDGQVELAPVAGRTADASISGTPLALLALAGPEAESSMRRGSVRIEGDAEIAQKFRELLRHARPDFEEELSRVFGDVAARRVANVARGLFDWGRRTTLSLATSASEYLQEEGRDVPTRIEMDEFLADVDRLREDADRLEARLSRLGPPRGHGS
jgi:ubiquinone biosynthesis protein UbiJ